MKDDVKKVYQEEQDRLKNILLYVDSQIISFILFCLGLFLKIAVWETFFLRKNVPDYSADRERSDLGFVVFDMFADILYLLL